MSPAPLPRKGDRIRTLAEIDDFTPIPAGSEGTVTFANSIQIGVDWDEKGRRLMLCPEDPFRIIA